MKQAIFLLIAASYCDAVIFPHTFKVCNRTTPELKKCLREAAQYNIHQLVHPFRDLRLPSLKPLTISSLTIGSGKRAVAVEQQFTNCHLYGFEHLLMEQFEFDFERKVFYLNCHIPELTKKCNYKLNGRVLLLPIQGEGDSTIVLRNTKIAGYFNYQEVKRNGKTYLKFYNHHLMLDVSNVYFHFDNLFDGNKGLGDNINRVLNDNWKEVFEDVKDGYAQVMNDLIQSEFNNFWSVVSLEEAFGEA